MKRGMWAVAAAVLCLSACQSAQTTQIKTTYDAQTQARIRLYGQNQKATWMTYRDHGKRVKVGVGGSLGDAFSSFTGTASNSSIGIAPTEMVKNMQSYNGMMSKIFYREFVIPAGELITVHNRFQGLNNTLNTKDYKLVTYQGSCRSGMVQFVPKAGHDYEVVPTHNSRDCGVTVFEVNANGGVQALQF